MPSSTPFTSQISLQYPKERLSAVWIVAIMYPRLRPLKEVAQHRRSTEPFGELWPQIVVEVGAGD